MRSSTAPRSTSPSLPTPGGGAGVGNSRLPSGDYQYMQCDEIREAISAAADGEASPLERSMVDAHIARCAGCAAFAGAVEQLDRRLRIRPAEAVPDLSAPILSASRAEAGTRVAPLRPAVGGAHGTGPRGSRVARRQTATRRFTPRTSSARGKLRSPSGCSSRRGSPGGPPGLLPFALALAGAMVATAAFDIVTGHVARGR